MVASDFGHYVAFLHSGFILVVKRDLIIESRVRKQHFDIADFLVCNFHDA